MSPTKSPSKTNRSQRKNKNNINYFLFDKNGHSKEPQEIEELSQNSEKHDQQSQEKIPQKSDKKQSDLLKKRPFNKSNLEVCVLNEELNVEEPKKEEEVIPKPSAKQ